MLLRSTTMTTHTILQETSEEFPVISCKSAKIRWSIEVDEHIHIYILTLLLSYWLSIQIYISYLQLVPAFGISICLELSQLYKSLQFSCIRQHSVHYVHLGDVDVVSVQHKPEPIPTRPDPASPSPCRVPRSPPLFFDVSCRPFPGDYAGVRAVVVD
jgi:hypothetical protein